MYLAGPTGAALKPFPRGERRNVSGRGANHHMGMTFTGGCAKLKFKSDRPDLPVQHALQNYFLTDIDF